MSTVEDDLKSFTQFVRQQIGDDSELKLPDLFDLWLLQNANREDFAENVAAINASYEDFKRGDRGSAAGEHSARLRREFGFNNE